MAHGSSASRRIESIIVSVVFGMVAWLYLHSTASFVLGHDNGEFVSIAAQGGVPHPSGFPGYVVWLRVLSWLPGLNPAHVAARATALLGILTVMVLYAALRAWRIRRSASLIAVAAFAGSAGMWRLSSYAENLSYTHLVAALCLLAVAPSYRGLVRYRAVVLGLLTGLGLSGNLLFVTVVPLVLAGLARHRARAGKGARSVGRFAFGLMLGLLPYGYLWFGAQAGPDALVWGEIDSVSALWRHASRAEYGVGLAMQHVSVPVTEQLSVFFSGIATEMNFLPFAAGIIALVITLRVAWVHRSRASMWLVPVSLAVCFILSGPVAAVLMKVPPRGLMADNLMRFRVLPALLLSVFFARFLHALISRFVRRFGWRTTRPFTALGAFTLVACVLHSQSTVADYVTPTVESYVRNTLRAAPSNAVLLGQGDERAFGMHYLTRVQGERRDVVHITPVMLFRSWYRARAAQRLGTRLPVVNSGRLDMVALVEQIMRTGRPVLVYDPDPNFGRLLAHFPNYPQGPLIRLLPRGQSVPDLESLTKRNLELLDQFTLEPKPTPQQRWSFHVYRRYAQPFHFLASEWQEAGDAKRAATMRSMADRFDPVASPEQRGGP